MYNIINYLNKDLITQFAWNLEKEKRYDTKTLGVDTVLNKNIFMKNHAENVPQKLVTDHFLILVNDPKQLLHVRNYFKKKMFCKMIIKKLLTSYLHFFFWTQALLMDKIIKNKRGLEPGQSLFRLWKKFRKIPLLVLFYLSKLDDVK